MEELELAIAEAQAKILKLQKQQAELDFLGQQVKLLELIQKHGLDAAEVMKGMPLGIGANARELFGAALTTLNLMGA